MSLKIIKTRIQKFLVTDTPQVLCLFGKWGVGKTFSWIRFYEEVENAKKLAILNYSYVSLFGINSIEELKFQIVANLKIRGKKEEKIANLITYGESAGRAAFKTGMFAKTPKFDISGALTRLGFFWIKKTIICLDDIERRGKGLELKDILGISNFLKEEKKCKVVLICNIGANQTDDETIQTYSEKVFDSTILVDLSPQESVEIALKKDTQIYDTLKICAVKLNIKNIRLLQKIEKVVLELENILKSLNFDGEILEVGIRSLTLFMACRLGETSELPTYSFARHFQGFLKPEASEEQKKWAQTLLEYGYNNTNEFSLELANYLEKGYFNKQEIKKYADLLKTRLSNFEQEEKFNSAWRLYHDTFANNQNEVVEKLVTSFKAGAKLISPLNLNGTVAVLRELGATNQANEIIDFYIAENENNKELFNLDEYSFAADITDQIIIEAFNQKYKSLFTQKTFEQTLKKIAQQHTWNSSDILILAEGTVEDFVGYFKNQTGDILSSSIKTCLQFKAYPNRPACIKAYDNCFAALLRIAEESPLNRRRVSRYINLPPTIPA